MAEDIQIVSVMSVPTCGWNPHWGCTTSALAPFGLADQVIMFGAWWDHGVSNAFEDLLERGNVDWILAIDYDSMFTAQDVSNLLKRFGENPHIDALAAIQPRRGSEETPIMSIGQNTEVEFTDEAVQCDTAHFGLTLFRVDALKNLFAKAREKADSIDAEQLQTAATVLGVSQEQVRGMVLACMLHIPDPNGSYRTKSRLDPDIYFWRRWREAGNTLYVDPHVRVGHLQPMVAEMHADDAGHLRTRHVHFMDWRKRTNSVKTETP
jgi:hypothetical protein